MDKKLVVGVIDKLNEKFGEHSPLPKMGSNQAAGKFII